MEEDLIISFYNKWVFNNYYFESKRTDFDIIIKGFKIPNTNGLIDESTALRVSSNMWGGNEQADISLQLVEKLPFGVDLIKFMLDNNILLNKRAYLEQIEKDNEYAKLPK